jgi:hypothetical protein
MTMRFFIFILILGCTVQYAAGQHVNAIWSGREGGMLYDQANAVALDASANVYATGYFQHHAVFGNQSLQAAGDTDMYLAKYDASGKLLWARTGGSDYNRPNLISETGATLAVTAAGDVYVSGMFRRVARFGEAQLVSAGMEDIFIAKYHADGTLAWLKRAGGSSQDVVRDAATDAEGNLYLTGYFQNDVTFDDVQLRAGEYTNFYIAKYNPSGALLWLKDGRQTGSASGQAIAVYDNIIVVAGNFTGDLSLNSHNINASSEANAFLATFSSSGKCTMLTQQAGTTSQRVSDLDAGAHGVVITGAYEDPSGSARAFVSLFTLNGELQWVKRSAGNASSDGKGVRFVDGDRIIAAGNFYDDIQWEDNRAIGGATANTFVAELTRQGSLAWLDNAGNTAANTLNSLASFHNQIVLAGMVYDIETSQGDALIARFALPPRSPGNEGDNHVLTVYPNPNQGQFTLHYTFLSQQPRCEVSVTDVIGRVVLQQSLTNVTSIDLPITLSDAANGLYTIQVLAGGFEVYRKVLIK